MASGKKIADGVAKMSPSPFIRWIRDSLLRVRRVDKDTQKPIKEEFVFQQRYPSDQSARTQPPPTVPGGIHHRLAQNYYYEHDARRAVEPPRVASATDKTLITGGETQLASAVGPQVSLGPAQNFGLPPSIAVPGLGHEWKRSRADELPTQQNDAEFTPLERYDGYRRGVSQ